MATNANITTLYWLLMAKYASAHINSDYPEQWRLKIMSTIFKYGPTWAKRLEIQEKVRALTDEEVSKGSISIYNNAANPDSDPTTDTWDTLPGINTQNASLHKRGKLEGYAMVDTILRTDVTTDFINQFKKFFITVLSPQRPLWYPSVGGDDETACMLNNDMTYGNYTTDTFEEMFPTVSDFIDYYRNCGIPTTIPEA